MADVDRVFVMANPAGRRETPQGVFAPLSKGQVALIEEHPNHPFDPMVGEHRVFIVQGDPPCEAYLSEGVTEKLVQNQLVQMSRADALTIYKKMTGNAYPGTEPEPEATPEEDEEAALEAARAVIARAEAKKQTEETKDQARATKPTRSPKHGDVVVNAPADASTESE
jgi:hypothetical protein